MRYFVTCYTQHWCQLPLFFLHQIVSVTDGRLKFYWKSYLLNKGWEGEATWKRVLPHSDYREHTVEECAHFLFFSGIEKARLRLRCELWSADGEGGWRVPYSKSHRWQRRPRLSPSVTVFALHWLLTSQGDVFLFMQTQTWVFEI